MSIKHLCDGCGKETDDVKEYGAAATVEYCDDCAPIWEAFSKERDELHEEVAQQWKDGLGALHEKYQDKLNTFPDAV